MKAWIIIVTMLIGFVIAAVWGNTLVPFLHKIHFGQPIKTDFGPKWHEKKAGTPTMGGFLFIVGSIVATAVGYILYSYFGTSSNVTLGNVYVHDNSGVYTLIATGCYCIMFGAMGFLDDFIKVSKKHNEGLKPWQKIVIQIIISAGYLACLYLIGDKSTKIDLIFGSFNAGIFYYPLLILVMLFMTNAVNLTDGIDGLCGSVTFIVMLFYYICSNILYYYNMSVFSAALAGSVLGFLVWNYHPAKCFMGDTGSMYLGAAVTSIAIVLHQHLFLVFVGIVYICEALSVVIQVTYFKITKRKYGEGRRIFKMTPIHHHFELSGFSEYKICITFSSATLIFGLIGLILVTINR